MRAIPTDVARMSVCLSVCVIVTNVKCKVFKYSLQSVGPGTDPGVQAVTLPPSDDRLPLLSARPAAEIRSIHQIAPYDNTHPIPAYYSFIDP